MKKQATKCSLKSCSSITEGDKALRQGRKEDPLVQSAGDGAQSLCRVLQGSLRHWIKKKKKSNRKLLKGSEQSTYISFTLKNNTPIVEKWL